MAWAPRRVVGNLAEDWLVCSLGPDPVYARLEFTLRKPIRMAEAPRWINGRVAPGRIEVNGRIAGKPAHAAVVGTCNTGHPAQDRRGQNGSSLLNTYCLS